MTNDNERPLSTGDWFLTILVLGIPLLNIIMYLIWAFGRGNVNRRNFCRASLLWSLIGIAIILVLAAAR